MPYVRSLTIQINFLLTLLFSKTIRLIFPEIKSPRTSSNVYFNNFTLNKCEGWNGYGWHTQSNSNLGAEGQLKIIQLINVYSMEMNQLLLCTFINNMGFASKT